MFHLGIPCAGHMTLPTDVMRQCHHYVGQCRQVNSKVFPHTTFYSIIHLILIFKVWYFIHQYVRRRDCGSQCDCGEGCVLGLVVGSKLNC